MSDEIKWNPIVIDGIPTRYEISEYGNVRNLETGNILVNNRLKISDRERVLIYYNGTRKSFKVHRLVYEAFYGKIPKNMTVDHIDEDIHNNHYSNLRLLTASENIKSYLSNHPDHGFQKEIPDAIVEEFFTCAKHGVYYYITAKRLGIRRAYASALLNGLRRRDIWQRYQPFPRSAHVKYVINPRDEEKIIKLIIDGVSSREICRTLNIDYNQSSIYRIHRIAQKFNIRNGKFFDESFLQDVDKLIIDGKSNQEIYDAFRMETSDRNSFMLARRRQRLGIKNPKGCCISGDPNELRYIEELILLGYTNDEIINVLEKEKTQYYVWAFARLRRKLKNKNMCNGSTTIETVADS